MTETTTHQDEPSRIIRVLDVAVRLAAVVSLVISGIVFQQIHEKNICQGRFNERTKILNPVIDRERVAREATDVAQAELWLNVRPGNTDPDRQAKVIGLFRVYQQSLSERQAAIAEANKVRAANPVPDCTP